MSDKPIICDWCHKPTGRDDFFCSDACRKAWLDDDRKMEFALEAAQDAAYDDMEREQRDAWEAMSDDERAEAWSEAEAPW